MAAKDRLIQRLTETFHPASIQLVDESHLHKGHAGHRPGGETHFRIKIEAEIFRGKSRVDVHRLINEALADEFAGGLHALAIEARAPSLAKS